MTAQDTNRPRLPLELIAEILDCLCGDKKTLAVCSLVCKIWTRPARYRLFEKVAIYPRVLLQLGSARATLPFIRHLFLTPSLGCLGSPFYNKILPRLVGLESIRSLSLTHFYWPELKPEAKIAFFAHFAAIVRLQLQVVKTSTFSELATIICAFPCLETLVVNGAQGWSDADPPPSALRLPRNMRELELRINNTNVFLKWLLSFPTTPALQTVYLHGALSEEINPFLQALGGSLKVFRYDGCSENAGKL